MAHLFDNQPDDVDYQAPQEEPQRRGWVRTAVAAALLAVIGMSSAVLWHAYGGSVPAFPSFASATGQPAATAVVADKPELRCVEKFATSQPS